MKPRLLPHDLRGQDVAFEHLGGRKDGEDNAHHENPSAILKEGHRQGDEQSHNRPEVGDDIEDPKSQSEEDAKFHSGDAEARREEDAQDETDDDLASEKGHQAARKLTQEEDQVWSPAFLDEGEFGVEVVPDIAVAGEEEGEVDRDNGETSEQTEEACKGSPGVLHGAEGGDPGRFKEAGEPAFKAAGYIRGLKLVEELDEAGVVLAGGGADRFDQLGGFVDEAEDLVDEERREDGDGSCRDDEDQGIEQGDGFVTREVQTALGHPHDRT